MNTTAYAYSSSNEINVIFTSYTGTTGGSSTFEGKQVDWQPIKLEFLNKVQCNALLHQLKSSLIVVQPELFDSNKIERHNKCINKLENHISETWPDYKVMYESWKKIAETAGEEYYEAKQEVYKLQQEVEDLKNQLKKAQKKIVYLKRA